MAVFNLRIGGKHIKIAKTANFVLRIKLTLMTFYVKKHRYNIVNLIFEKNRSEEEVWTRKNRILLLIKKKVDGIGANRKKAKTNPTFLEGGILANRPQKRAFVPQIWQKYPNLAPFIFYLFPRKITLLFRYSDIPFQNRVVPIFLQE